MIIKHISDLHYRSHYAKASDGYESVLCRMRDPLIPLANCLKQMKEEGMDLLLFSGDLCDGGSVEDYRRLKAFFDEYLEDIPLVISLGNHDIKENFAQGWLNTTISSSHYHQMKQIDDTFVLSLDNTCEDANGRITKAHVAWLKEKLVQCQGKQIILMMHHHLLPNQAAVGSAPYVEEFKNLVKDSNISCILCGHTHHPYSDIFAEKPYYTAPSMSFCGEDMEDGSVRFEEKFGYNTYHLEHGMITYYRSDVYSSGKILNTITF